MKKIAETLCTATLVTAFAAGLLAMLTAANVRPLGAEEIDSVVASVDGELFAAWSQLRRVMAVVIPTAVYVFAIPYLGIYVASTLLIAVFMRWLGRYPWHTVAAVAIGMPILTFFLFEIWFLVPLPKGPLEHQLGY